MGRKSKEISEEVLTQAEENPEQIPEIAQQVNVNPKTIQNHIKKKKLSIAFTADSGDANPPQIGTNTIEQKPIDYHLVAKSFVQAMDGGMPVMAFVISRASREKEYYWEKLTAAEIEMLTSQLEQNQGIIQFIQNTPYLGNVIGLAAFAFTGMAHFKSKPKQTEEKEIKSEVKDIIVSTNSFPTNNPKLEMKKFDAQKEEQLENASDFKQQELTRIKEQGVSLASTEKPMFKEDFDKEMEKELNG